MPGDCEVEESGAAKPPVKLFDEECSLGPLAKHIHTYIQTYIHIYINTFIHLYKTNLDFSPHLLLERFHCF